MRTSWHRRRIGVLGSSAAALALTASLVLSVGPAARPALAAGVISVETTDGGPPVADAFCSLSEAIDNANNDNDAHTECEAGAGNDTISFNGTPGTVTIFLTGSLPSITDVDGVTIDGAGRITVDGSNLYAIIQVNAPATFNELNLSNGNNTAGNGSIIVGAAGNLTYVHGLLYSNEALGNGGAFYNSGTLTVQRSSFSHNDAQGNGGAIFNAGTATVSNSSFSFQGDAYNSGAVHTSGTFTSYNSTFAENRAGSATGEGSALNVAAGTASLYNSILANSSFGVNCYVAGGASISGNNNLIEDAGPACGTFTDGVSGNIVNIDPDLAYLGGTPAAWFLSSRSPAIDAGSDSSLGGATVDQAGNGRMDDVPWVIDTGSGTAPIVDMGATEYQFSCPGGSKLYVDSESTEDENGQSWTFPYHDLQVALSIVDECGSPSEVWVANGVYKPDAADPGNRSLSFNIPPGTKVYGGFASGETLLTQRNWETNVAVLSGDLDGNDDSSNTDGNYISENYGETTGSNSYHVVLMDGQTTAVTATTVLDGFTITSGLADGGGADNYAGGMGCDATAASAVCSPTLANLIFSGNRANYGGGIALQASGLNAASSPSLTNTLFTSNLAGQSGGGLFGLTLTSTAIASPVLTDVTFDGNYAGFAGAGMFSQAAPGTSSPTLNDVRFNNNFSAAWSGGMYNIAVGSAAVSSPTLLDVTFYNNTAVNGGAVANRGNSSGTSSPKFSRATFNSNTASGAGSGGAVYNLAESSGTSSPTFFNSTFFDNDSGSGGAVFNYANGAGTTSSPRFINVTFNSNSATGDGGAIHSLNSSGSLNPELTNVILWGDDAVGNGDEIYENLSTTDLNHSVVQAGASTGIFGSTAFNDGTGNIDLDPKLGTLTNNGGLTETIALLPGSAAIDAGDDAACADANTVNNEDQAGQPRPAGLHCEIGALEFDPNAYTDVVIGGSLQGRYLIPWTESAELGYADLNDGPVEVQSDPARFIVASQQTGWRVGGVIKSMAKTMGLPASQLSDTYYFPWYAHSVWVDTELRIGNAGSVPTDVNVTIGPNSHGPYHILPGDTVRPKYPGEVAGPITVEGTATVPLIVSERMAWKVAGNVTTVADMIGMPDGLAADAYYFPWYRQDSVTDTELRMSNVGLVDSSVTVQIGSNSHGPYLIHPNTTVRTKFTGEDSGPMTVTGTLGVPLVVSQRLAWKVGGNVRTVTEMLGMSADQAKDTAYFPWYAHNSLMNTELRVANVGGSDSNVYVTIGDTTYGPNLVQDNQTVTLQFAGVDTGPVTVKGTAAVPLVVTENLPWKWNGVVYSLAEQMGLPSGLLGDGLWFSYYAKITGKWTDTELRIGAP